MSEANEMNLESRDVVLKFRCTETEAAEIKAICYDLTHKWGRDYNVSDYLRDASCLFKKYHTVKDQLLFNFKALFPVIWRLPVRSNNFNDTVVPLSGHDDK